jgi:hypothetical protein
MIKWSVCAPWSSLSDLADRRVMLGLIPIWVTLVRTHQPDQSNHPKAIGGYKGMRLRERHNDTVHDGLGFSHGKSLDGTFGTATLFFFFFFFFFF